MSRKVKEKLPKETVEAAARSFGLDPGLLTFVRDVANVVYATDEGASARYLRLSHADDHSADEIHAEIEWLQFLRAEGLPVCRPLPASDGAFVVEPTAVHTAVLFARVRGEPVSEAEFDEPVFEQMGGFLGRLHEATARFRPADPSHVRPHWTVCDDFDRVLASWDPSDRVVANAWPGVHARIARGLEDAAPDDLVLIHADLHRGNVFNHAEGIEVFDFDDSCYFLRAADIAIAVFYALWGLRYAPDAERAEFANRFLAALLRGYRAELPIDDTELALLPALLEYRELTVDAFSHRRLHGSPPDEEASRRWPQVRERLRRDAPYVELDLASHAAHEDAARSPSRGSVRSFRDDSRDV